jgi:hypothetical protein
VSIRTPENRAKFQAHIDQLRREGKCQCFECLRAEGFTPPLSKRKNHPGIGPHRVFGKDEGGEPYQTEGKGSKRSKEEDAAWQSMTAEEHSHLKEAVANRAVI